MASSKKKKVCVVGAGVSGLASARELLREGHDVTVMEQSGDVGGQWLYDTRVDAGDPLGAAGVHSSMYSSVRLFTPRQVTGFSGFPFYPSSSGAGDARRYPCHGEFLRYIRDFCHAFGLMDTIRLNTKVLRVGVAPLCSDDDGTMRWTVRFAVKQGEAGGEVVTTEEEVFDAVVVAVGQYTQPRLPTTIDGMDMWTRRQLHSHSYRVPDSFSGEAVVVVGFHKSGKDIALELCEVASEVHVSVKSMDHDVTPGVSMALLHPQIDRLCEDGRVVFVDGSCVVADAIIYCTGYDYSFPFLDTGGLVTVDDNRVGPLFDHTFPPAMAPSLSFVGIPNKVVVSRFYEVQARWVAQVLSGRRSLPAPEEMTRAAEEYNLAREIAGVPKRRAHDVSDLEYCDVFGEERCGFPALEEWKKELLLSSIASMRDRTESFRDDYVDSELVMAGLRSEGWMACPGRFAHIGGLNPAGGIGRTRNTDWEIKDKAGDWHVFGLMCHATGIKRMKTRGARATVPVAMASSSRWSSAATMASSSKTKKVCVIAPACRLLREGHAVTVMEQSAGVGGQWLYDPATDAGDPLGAAGVHSGVYASLRLNAPRDSMGFSDFPFFPQATTPAAIHVGNIRDFCHAFGLMNVVRINTKVLNVSPRRDDDGIMRWTVRCAAEQGDDEATVVEEVFDAVVVASGQYSHPRLPTIDVSRCVFRVRTLSTDKYLGMESWRRRQLHSHSYRVPDSFRDEIVVVVGCGESGKEIALELREVAREVHVSVKSMDAVVPGMRKAIERMCEDGRVMFADGSCVVADAIIYCTGYDYSFPFLDTGGLVSVDDNRVGPLYEHTFPPAMAPSLSFVGVPSQVAAPRFYEVQARWVAQVLSGRRSLPETEEIMCAAREVAGGVTRRLSHAIFFDLDYCDEFAEKHCGFPRMEGWKKELLLAAIARLRDDTESFRDDYHDSELVVEGLRSEGWLAKASPDTR
ncbi:hypothetical protein HU200_034826 [Digitaria exilis]|uniref:Flavin-containing monooxygenase n=1 Tax=Digitaria exilis TaxID=1010633 RepID=A0A835BJB4_9POAL|nr:hypothetical protein HU200_034826 [Digitaria exilis]